MKTLFRAKKLLVALSLGVGLASAFVIPVQARDLGAEGQVFEPIEEDMRIMLMRLLARQDWSESTAQLEDSAKSYTKNLPAYFLPRADKTETVWKDVGIVVTEDIYLPWVDWQNGSVFEPEQRLAVEKGTYLNPIAKLPSAAIERLFLFDATDPDQLSFAKELMRLDIPQLHFMLVAGDLGELSQEMNRPIYHPTPTMLEKFHVKAVPTLIGFGRGQHQGHMAVTAFKIPTEAASVKQAWFGLPHAGYAPDKLDDVIPESLNGLAGAQAEAQETLRNVTPKPPAASKQLR